MHIACRKIFPTVEYSCPCRTKSATSTLCLTKTTLRYTYVEPLGVVVVLVGVEGDTGHEAEGGVEVLEHEGALDGLATVDEGPVLELGEGLGLFLGGELLESHFSFWSCGGGR